MNTTRSIPLLVALTLFVGAPVANVANAAPKKTRLAVMTFKSVGTPEGFAEGLTETFATAAANTLAFDVVSPRQVSAVLAYEKRKELVGSCDDDSCYSQVAKLVKARHIIGGSVAQVGDRLVLNVALIDASKGQALARRQRSMASAAALIADVKQTAIVLLQPLLKANQGYVKVNVNVPDANIVIDDRIRSESTGQVITLAAGPHVLRVDRDGFYSANAELLVQPGRMAVERVDLIPARQTVEDYERRATWMRAGAWTTGALAVASAVGAAVFYSLATDNKDFTDRFATSQDINRSSVGTYEQYLEERDAFDTNQGLYLGFSPGRSFRGPSPHTCLSTAIPRAATKTSPRWQTSSTRTQLTDLSRPGTALPCCA